MITLANTMNKIKEKKKQDRIKLLNKNFIIHNKYDKDFIKTLPKFRTKRDDLMKAFFRWKNMCRKPEEYYPKITRGFNILTKYSKKQLCQEPFDLISITRNFERPLTKILKNIKNQEKRLLNGKLRKK